MTVLCLVLLGLALGSFVNALVWRLHAGRDWVKERSECTHCHHILAPMDLIPVLSWVWLRGRCRYCRKPIEDSPITELAVPFLFVLSYCYWPLALSGVGLFTFVLWLIFLVGFVALSVYDLKWMILPDVIVWPLVVLAVAGTLVVWLGYHGSFQHVLGTGTAALIISGLFGLIYVISKGKWIGFGDVKLGIALGLLAGSPLAATLVLFIASLAGMLISLPLLFLGKAQRKSQIPFGPLLILGLIVTVLFGQSIIDWYSSALFRI